MEFKIQISEVTEIERFVLVLNLGMLQAIEQGLMSIDEAYSYFYRPYIAQLIESFGGRKELVDLLNNSVMLEDILDLVPLSFPKTLTKYKQITASLLDSLSKSEGPKYWLNNFDEPRSRPDTHWINLLQMKENQIPMASERIPAPLPVLPGITGPMVPTFAEHGYQSRVIDDVQVLIPPMVPIPSGPFLMGSDPAKDTEAYKDEQPQYIREIAKPYYIAKYPITVAEYTLFLQANPLYPKPQEERYSEEEAYGGGIFEWRVQQTRPEHPVVLISWKDALTYVQWLAQVIGLPYRIPTDVEWEKSARGTDGRIYPWGNKFDENKANTNNEVGMTTPVWQYPDGASPYGVMDMSGNVSEWTSTVYFPYSYKYNENLENLDVSFNRVVRGGSWSRNPSIARAAFREDEATSHTTITQGFRVAINELIEPS